MFRSSAHWARRWIQSGKTCFRNTAGRPTSFEKRPPERDVSARLQGPFWGRLTLSLRLDRRAKRPARAARPICGREEFGVGSARRRPALAVPRGHASFRERYIRATALPNIETTIDTAHFKSSNRMPTTAVVADASARKCAAPWFRDRIMRCACTAVAKSIFRPHRAIGCSIVVTSRL